MFSPQSCAPNAAPSFSDYSEKMRRALQPAVITPLVDPHKPGDYFDGAFVGVVGAFQAQTAIITPTGQWSPVYTGIVPVSAQQQIETPEPWLADEG